MTTELPTSEKWFRSPKRYFLDAPKEHPGTCFVLNDEYVIATEEIERLQREIQELRLQAIADFGQYQEALERAAQAPSDELSQCPFCGSDGASIGGDEEHGFYVACGSLACYVAVGEGYGRDAMPDHAFRTEADAMSAWNKRAAQPPSAGDAGLSGLLEECEQFVNSHSETWYRSGQDLLARIRAMQSRPATQPGAGLRAALEHKAIAIADEYIGYPERGPEVDADCTCSYCRYARVRGAMTAPTKCDGQSCAHCEPENGCKPTASGEPAAPKCRLCDDTKQTYPAGSFTPSPCPACSAQETSDGPEALLHTLEVLRQQWSHNVNFEAAIGECKEEIELCVERSTPLAYPYKCKHSNHPGLCPECLDSNRRVDK